MLDLVSFEETQNEMVEIWKDHQTQTFGEDDYKEIQEELNELMEKAKKYEELVNNLT